MLKSIFKNKAERLAAFEKADLYPVISSEFTLGRPVVEIFAAAARGGVRLIQLREKNRSKKELFGLGCACRAIADEYRVLLIINDHLDVALACGADGVHLGQDDLPVNAARELAGELIIGSSTHNLAEALAAEDAGADYINIGPIYATGTKSLPMPPLGVGMIGVVAAQVGLPFTVMGGIKARHIPELRAAGAKRIAMVTEVTQAPDVEAQIGHLRSLF
jgi:thiamine-phosphate pyrophosphorylase